MKKISSYIRLARFNTLFGALLLMLPSFWSLALNNLGTNMYWLLGYYIIFFIGAILMRGFGCVINDMADIKIDSQVKRTANRPLANGELSKKEALLFLLILGFLSSLLLLFFNQFAIIIAISSIVIVFIYPFCKRFTNAPQFILGLAFNWGILLADAVLNKIISFNSIILYVGSIIWTIAYDTIYAYQDYEDDKKIGVKSTTMLIGEKPKKVLVFLYLTFFMVIIFLGLLNKFSIYFYILNILASLLLLYRLIGLDHKNSLQCGIFFKGNVYFAILIWISFIIK